MAAQETAIQNNPSRMKKFLREVKAELKKVSWPDRKELASHTGVVFISVLAVALLIWAADFVLVKVLSQII